MKQMAIKRYLYNLATDKNTGLIAGTLKILLLALSFLYGLVVRILILFSRLLPCRLNCKVISIGNITWGGTGKTPLVEYAARYLQGEGRKVAILSRGYKKLNTQDRGSLNGYAEMGDEPYMLKMHLRDIPVIVDSNRIRAAKLAIYRYGADTLILDDGFQQWRIKKDLDMVTIDSAQALGNYHLIPRGILREPLAALKRADLFMLTKTNIYPQTQKLEEFLRRVNPRAAICASIHNPVGFYRLNRKDELLNVDALKGKTVALISGIADPDAFENLIKKLGLNIGLSFRFPDHYQYLEKDMDKISQEARNKNIDALITTEKDAVRLLSLSAPAVAIFVLRIEFKITKNEDAFLTRLRRLYSL